MEKAYHSGVHRATPPARMAEKAARAASLGSTARFATDATTQHVQQGLRAIGPDSDKDKHRRQRYWLQDVAQAVMSPYVMQNSKGEIVSRYKVCMCDRTAVPGAQGIQTDMTAQGAVYRTMKCKSVWHCPVCSAVISKRRGEQLVQGFTNAEKQQNCMVLLITYTARHDAQTPLAWQYKAMTAAHRRLWSGGDIKALKQRYGIVGLVRNLEVTYSKLNGWHTHIHETVVMRQGATPEENEAKVKAFSDEFRVRWERIAGEFGLSMDEHGFDCSNSTARIAWYLEKFDRMPKWREADELTKWQKKLGKSWSKVEHLSPWQLLEYAAAGRSDAAALFREYAQVFHGKKQLHWSKGLKVLLGVEEKTDEELVDEAQEDSPVLFSVVASNEDFAEHVARPRLRSHYLEVVELMNPDVIRMTCMRLFGFMPQIVTAEDEAVFQRRKE